MRIIALVDGDHHPAVVRAALQQVGGRFSGSVLVGAVLLGGSEKLVEDNLPDLGVPVVTGPTPDDALAAGLETWRPDLAYDLSDEPVLDARTRLRLASRALVAGTAFHGADFRLDPPPRPRLAAKPSLAVIATGKRTGKTAVVCHLARLLRERGTPPVVVAMGRGGPEEPEVVDPAVDDLSPEGLLALARSGRHAASDHLEDAVMSGVTTVGSRRCGGGLAGAPVDDTFGAGVALANARDEPVLLLEGSGQAIPPARADATVLVVPAGADPELVVGYLGAYRVLLSDLIVVTMDVTSPAEPAARASFERDVQGLAQGVSDTQRRVVHVTLQPTPLAPISGRRVFYATTAAGSAVQPLAAHLEHQHGGKVVGTSHHLADRRLLAADLERAEDAEVLVVELKAAAIDLAARFALERGMEVVFCDNRVVSIGGDSFEEAGLAVADLAAQRFSS